MCASKMLRRSGVACGLVCDVIGWRADTVISVGIGYNHQEVDVLKEEWPGVRFYGIEPHPDVLDRANKEGLFDLLFQVAASDRQGTATLHAKRRHADGSSLLKVAEDCREFTVETDTLDAMFPVKVDLGRLLLWLDCEGNELKVLSGAVKLIERVRVVNVELTAGPQSPDWCSTVDVHRRLVGLGFYAQWTHTHRITDGQLDCIYVRPELFSPRHCCFPWEIERHKEECG
jgi:FkbM family methyltransferase